jgi:hypothetical protein
MFWYFYRFPVFSCWALPELIKTPQLAAVTALQAFLVPSVEISINEHIASTPGTASQFPSHHGYHLLNAQPAFYQWLEPSYWPLFPALCLLQLFFQLL